MLTHLKSLLAAGPIQTSLMSVGGNIQVLVKVQIEQADEIGILCRTKGMLGGYGDLQIRPWASIAWMDVPN